jgi:RimJ/RimL family protein N-acetyltransferase
MRPQPDWPVAGVIETARLVLEPLRVDHATEMAPLLDDEALHAYIGGHPLTVEQLRDRYERQVAGRSADGEQGWLNWIVRDRDSGAAVGTVQATMWRAGRTAAEVAWVIATRHQGQGYAGEAAAAMAGWLRGNGADLLIAHVHPDHRASIRVAERLGLTAGEVRDDGEVRWTGVIANRRTG